MEENDRKLVRATVITAWAAVAATIASWVGVAVTFYTANWSIERVDLTIQRMDQEREDRLRPQLAFLDGAFNWNLNENNSAVHAKDDATGIRPLFRATNFGASAAVNARLIWVPVKAWTNKSQGEVDTTVHLTTDEIALSPGVIGSGKEGGIYRLPHFIHDDKDRQLRRIEGSMMIQANDVRGKPYNAFQKFHVIFHYEDPQPWVNFHVGPVDANGMVIFGDEMFHDPPAIDVPN